MDITVITPGDDRLPPAPCSSVDIYDYQLSKELSHRHAVHLYAKGAKAAKEQRLGITIHTFPVQGSGMVYLSKILRELPSHHHHVIQIDNRPGYVVGVRRRFSKMPLVLNLHSANFLAPVIISDQGVRDTFRACDKVVANSHYLRRELERRYPQFKAKYHVIYPGVDLRQFPWRETPEGLRIRHEMRQKYQIGNKTVMLFVGRFLPRKGIPVLLQAFRQLKKELTNVELWIVGGRPLRDTPFHRQVRALAKGLPVRFFPFTSSSLVHRYYLASDLFLCPSQLPESFGMVNIEAAASGLPAVGSDAWGIRESILEGVSGWRVKDYRSARAWAEKLRSLLHDRSQWEMIGRQARAWAVRTFAWQRVAVEFASLYQSLAKKKPTEEIPVNQPSNSQPQKARTVAKPRTQLQVAEVKPSKPQSAKTELTTKWHDPDKKTPGKKPVAKQLPLGERIKRKPSTPIPSMVSMRKSS